MADLTPEALAQAFHEAYERLAPSFGYETRKASAVPWAEVPEQNKALMVAVAGEVLGERIAALERVLAELVAAHYAPPWGGGDDPDYEKALAAGRRMDAAWDRAREALEAGE